MAQNAADLFWQPGDKGAYPDRADHIEQGGIYKPEYLEYISSTIATLDKELFELSQDIHGKRFSAPVEARLIEASQTTPN